MVKPTFLDENEIQRRALKTVRGRIAEETTAGQTIREKPDPVVRHENIPIDTRTRYELYLLQKRTRGGGGGGSFVYETEAESPSCRGICFAANKLASVAPTSLYCQSVS